MFMGLSLATPSIGSYEEAVATWEKIGRALRTDLRERPLRGKKDNVSAIIFDGDSVRLRLYETDVVIYYEDGSITLQPYATMTTNQFANRLLPGNVHMQCSYGRSNRPHCVVISEPCERRWQGRYYRFPQWWNRSERLRLTPKGKGWKVENFEPWKLKRLDQARAQAVLRKHKYHDFVVWANGYRAMEQQHAVQRAMALDFRSILELFDAGYEGWVELVNYRWWLADDEVRQALYWRDGKVGEIVEKDWLRYEQIAKYLQADRRLYWVRES